MILGRLDFGLGSLAGDLVSDLGQAYDRARDRHLRLAVTGLRRSGKTVLTTALVHHLLDGHGLPFVAAVHEERYLGGKLLPVPDDLAFPYARFHADLAADPPHWPAATEQLSRLRIELRFRTTNVILRQVQPIQRLVVEIIDYPGEWLLDLPLLEMSFEAFSKDALARAERPPRAVLARPWLEMLASIEQTGAADMDLAQRLANAYRRYLERCRDELGFTHVQPGRFLDADAASNEAYAFCPLPPAPVRPGSLRALLAERFERYREGEIRAFYEEHFSRFDRQIVLVDLLTALNRGPAHFADTQEVLSLIMESFRYGERSLLSRLFAPRIDRLLFAASKADHVAPSQHAALKHLLERLVLPASRRAKLEGLAPEVLALASLRCTDVVRTEHHGQVLSCVRGRLKDEDRETVLFPGEVPPEPPEPEEWSAERFRFRDFAPRRLEPGKPGQHIRLDQAIELLIGDKLR